MPKRLFRNRSATLLACLLTVLLVGLYRHGTALPAPPLDDWRNQAVAARALADNDAPTAYLEAQRLEAELPHDATPADRTRLLNLLARIEFYLALTEPAGRHVQLARDLATQNGDREGEAEALLITSLIAIYQAKLDDLMSIVGRSAELLEARGRPDLQGEALLMLSMTYRRIGQIDDAVTVAMQALEISKRGNSEVAEAYAHLGMAVSYRQSDRFEEAREHYLQMREHARAALSKLLEAQALEGLGATTERLGDPAGAERILRDAIDMFRAIGTPFSLNLARYALAEVLGRLGRQAEAAATMDEAVALYRQYPNPIGLWYALDARSGFSLNLGRAVPARRDAEEAYALAAGIGAPLYRSQSAQRLARLAAADGDLRRAYRLAVEAAEMTEQAAREKIGTRMLERVQRFEAESKQRHIEELTRRDEQHVLRQRWLLTLFGASILLLASVAYFLFRLQGKKRKLEESSTQLRALAARNEAAREEERRRIAREVHDELGQILTGLKLNIDFLNHQCPADSPAMYEHLQETMVLAEQALAVTRNVAAALRPGVLDMGIAVALEWLTERFAANTGIPCALTIEDQDIELDEAHAIALFRVAQESLTNIARHAHAERAELSFCRESGDYVLTVRDNGVGFAPGAGKAGSFGLIGMRERILALGGTLDIDSRAGGGTKIAARIPGGKNWEAS